MWAPGQAETDHSNKPFFVGEGKYLAGQTIAQDAGRATDIEPNTLMAQNATTRKFVPLTDVDPAMVAGKMVCGAFGSTAAAMAAISNGSFKVQIDGEPALDITGLDFREISSLAGTKASLVCGANGANLATWEAVVNGGFALTVNGTLVTVADVSFDGITSLGEVASAINTALAGTDVECKYNATTDVFSFVTKTRGATSTITAVVAGGTTDISGAGFLNGLTGVGVITAGTGTDDLGETVAGVINAKAAGRFRVEFDGSAFTFISPTTGSQSAVSVLTAGSAGTDISGAGYLNGLTGTGTATAGSGTNGENFPAGIYRGAAIATADIVAGDTTGDILIGGPLVFAEDDLVMEGSLTMNTVIPSLGVTIRMFLMNKGLNPRTVEAVDANV